MSSSRYETYEPPYEQARADAADAYGGAAYAYQDPYRPAYETSELPTYGAGEPLAEDRFAEDRFADGPRAPWESRFPRQSGAPGAVAAAGGPAPTGFDPGLDADLDPDPGLDPGLDPDLDPDLASGLGSDPGPRPGGRVEARRASRRRRAGDGPPETLRRLLPQALVVAFLAGGTSAFVASDKAVHLIVDGKQRTLHTFADDVGELLADEGVDVGAHDIVAPAEGTALASGDEVAVRYGRPVQLTLDGERRKVWTTAHTVDGALRQLGVRAEGAYLSASRSKRIARDGLDLDVRTERTVTIMADGRERKIRTNAATVREAVEESGVTLRGQDTTSVAPESFPRDGQTVTVMRVTGAKEVREEAIPFEVERTQDPSLFKGTEVVVQQGRQGARRVTYTLRTVNGVKQRPKRVRTEVVREPQKQIVKVGTKQAPTSVTGADGLNWSGLAHCESGGRPSATDPSGTYGGLYQFDTRTWQALGGSGRPQDAPASEQTFRAKKLYVQRGASPWPHCGRRLHG